jgi:hypothetical protein
MVRWKNRKIYFLIFSILVLSCGIFSPGVENDEETTIMISDTPSENILVITSTVEPNNNLPATKIVVPTQKVISNPPTNPARPTETLFPEKILHSVSDADNVIKAVLPKAWNDTRTEPWVDKKNQPIGVTFISAVDVDAFLNLSSEGVAISITKHPETGYIQLLENEAAIYKKICEDTYKTTWNVDHSKYRGKYVVLCCSSNPDSWLSIMTLVSKKDPGTYVARVIGLDMVPTYGDQFRDILLQFSVNPENLP